MKRGRWLDSTSVNHANRKVFQEWQKKLSRILTYTFIKLPQVYRPQNEKIFSITRICSFFREEAVTFGVFSAGQQFLCSDFLDAFLRLLQWFSCALSVYPIKARFLSVTMAHMLCQVGSGQLIKCRMAASEYRHTTEGVCLTAARSASARTSRDRRRSPP